MPTKIYSYTKIQESVHKDSLKITLLNKNKKYGEKKAKKTKKIKT